MLLLENGFGDCAVGEECPGSMIKRMVARPGGHFHKLTGFGPFAGRAQYFNKAAKIRICLNWPARQPKSYFSRSFDLC
jgi:hypothetical protein